ncbi:protein of unknown function [Melghirimyces thermohalophilus]|uniref:DUF4145 domain-containing protein n=1 Tax=Melghirimyces thermohalophilus TaxID=1236220 RepID=A0A1G6RMW5_9BACL|nr:DUF4145 domain-containing protein [Melghirimyces thermohalophilus]SDD05345.1 protein of unknown function [Melghirimyces thermohalophilus]
MEEKSLFAFLKERQPAWAEEAEEMERVVYHDPPSALTRSRKWMETLIRWVMREEKIVDVYEKLVERIQKLYRGGWITESIYQKMEWLRLEGNKAAHRTGYGTVEESLKAHRLVYELAVWWTEVYGDPDFQAPSYRHPPVDKGVDAEAIEKVISRTLNEKFRGIEDILKQPRTETAATAEPKQDGGSDSGDSSFDLIDYLKEHGLEPIDKRPAGGSLWVVGGWELNKVLFPLKERKIYFRFSKKGGRATNRKPGWFLLVKASRI